MTGAQFIGYGNHNGQHEIAKMKNVRTLVKVADEIVALTKEPNFQFCGEWHYRAVEGLRRLKERLAVLHDFDNKDCKKEYQYVKELYLELKYQLEANRERVDAELCKQKWQEAKPELEAAGLLSEFTEGCAVEINGKKGRLLTEVEQGHCSGEVYFESEGTKTLLGYMGTCDAWATGAYAEDVIFRIKQHKIKAA